MATMTNGKHLNQCALPIAPHEYLMAMKPMHPMVAA